MALTQVDGGLLNPINAQYTGFKNRIINPGMVIDQRNAGASVTMSAASVYTVDRWWSYEDTDGSMTAQRSTVAPAGFTNSLLCTTTSADASLSATQRVVISQSIEGFNMADFGWGTANAQTVTLSFWVRSSLTGAFGGAVKNNGNRSYPFSYTISATNTWEQKTVTITGDTTGTWVSDNATGIQLQFALGAGSTFSGTAGAWVTSDLNSVTGATSVVGTSGATFYITGVQLEKGSTATSFDYRPYGTELGLCQRYFQTIKGTGRHFIGGNGSVSGSFPTMYLRVTMRDTPSYSASSVSHFTIEGLTGGGQSTATSLSINAVTLDTVTIQALSGGSTSATAAQVFGNTAAAMSSFSAEL